MCLHAYVNVYIHVCVHAFVGGVCVTVCVCMYVHALLLLLCRSLMHLPQHLSRFLLKPLEVTQPLQWTRLDVAEWRRKYLLLLTLSLSVISQYQEWPLWSGKSNIVTLSASEKICLEKINFLRENQFQPQVKPQGKVLIETCVDYSVTSGFFLKVSLTCSSDCRSLQFHLCRRVQTLEPL